MLLQSPDAIYEAPPTAVITKPRGPARRHKKLGRRLARDARVFGPFLAIAAQALALAATIAFLERAPDPASIYWPTTSSSSTSNVSTAPPGIGPAPLSP